MIIKTSLALLLSFSTTAATAAVIVLGNYRTGEVVIQGNWHDGREASRAVELAKGGSDAGWVQLYGPDDDERGWGAVLCVRHKEGLFFAEAIGEVSEAEALKTVHLKANRFIARLVGGEDAALLEKSATWPGIAQQAADTGAATKVECAPTWNNQGQQIEFVGKPTVDGTTETQSVARASDEQAAPKDQEAVNGAVANVPQQQAAAAAVSAPAPKRDYESEYQERKRLWEQQLAEHHRKVQEHQEAQRQVEALKAQQREQAQGVLGDYQRQLAEHAAAAAAFAEEHRRWQIATQQQVPGAPNAGGSGTGIADAFKMQNDAEWKKVSEGLPQPRDFPGAIWAYCYQPSHVDSVLYEAEIATTVKTRTELELDFADVVAKITRIGSAMSTHCHLTNDATYLMLLRDNVRRVHADRKRGPQLFLPR